MKRFAGSSSFSVAALAAFVLSFAAPSAAQQVSTNAAQEMNAIMAEKSARTPEQQKIDSQLLQAQRESRGDQAQPGAPSVHSTAEYDASGAALVDIDAQVTSALLQRITDDGGSVVNSVPQFNSIRAWLPLDKLDDVAALSEVGFIEPYRKAVTNKIDTSEGDITHRTNLARPAFNTTGAGVRIGILSDSSEALATLQGSGDLPPACPGSCPPTCPTACSRVLSGQAGSGTSEGTAMMEIVTDLAPGAVLFFETGFPTAAQFATNILDLASTGGATVIVDDLTYFAEPVFQDGVIAQAVNAVVGAGVAYYSSAANDGSKNKGTSGTWEGNYVGTSLPGVLSGAGVSALDFGGGANTDQITKDPPNIITLQWSDPFGASSNDYDLFLLDPTGSSVLASSTNVQSGSQDPKEFILSPGNDVNNRIVIVKHAGAADRFIHLATHRGQLAINTNGATFGHNAGQSTASIAAVDVATTGCPACKPFVGGATNPVETFSSDGPRRIFFLPNGTPITPGNFLATGGLLLKKPDFSAADGVQTATPGFNPFFGTSAAAPHAAAIAALIRSRNPNLSVTRLNQIMAGVALDTEARGIDENSGSGILDGFTAIRTAGSAPSGGR